MCFRKFQENHKYLWEKAMSAVEEVFCKTETVGNLTEYDINSVILGEEYAIEHSKSETIDSGDPKNDFTNVNIGNVIVVNCETSRENGRATSKQVLTNGNSSKGNVGCDTTGANGEDTSERDVNNLSPHVTIVGWEHLVDCDTPRVYLERLSNDVINKWRKLSTVQLPNPGEPLRSVGERMKLYHSFLQSDYTLECPVCKKAFLHKQKIVRHVREVHLKLLSAKPYKPRKPTLSRKLMKLEQLNGDNSSLLVPSSVSCAPLEHVSEWVAPATEQFPQWVPPVEQQLPEWVAPMVQLVPEWVPPVVIKVESCQTLTSTDIEKALTNIKLGLEILEESDPNRDRSSATVRRINDSIQCYKDLRRQLNKLNDSSIMQ